MQLYFSLRSVKSASRTFIQKRMLSFFPLTSGALEIEHFIVNLLVEETWKLYKKKIGVF